MVEGQPAAVDCTSINSLPEANVIWHEKVGSSIHDLRYREDRVFASANHSLLFFEPKTTDTNKIFQCIVGNSILTSPESGYIQIKVTGIV